VWISILKDNFSLETLPYRQGWPQLQRRRPSRFVCWSSWFEGCPSWWRLHSRPPITKLTNSSLPSGLLKLSVERNCKHQLAFIVREIQTHLQSFSVCSINEHIRRPPDDLCSNFRALGMQVSFEGLVTCHAGNGHGNVIRLVDCRVPELELRFSPGTSTFFFTSIKN